MSSIDQDLKYARSHEWVRQNEDGSVTVGISAHAAELLGDLVFVELPDVGQAVTLGDEMAVVESVKAASDVYAPVSGAVIEVNAELSESPGLVNDDPYQAGWLVKLKLEDPEQLHALLDSKAYQKIVETENE